MWWPHFLVACTVTVIYCNGDILTDDLNFAMVNSMAACSHKEPSLMEFYVKVHQILGSCPFQWCGFHWCTFFRNSPNIQLMWYKWRNSFTHTFFFRWCGFLPDLNLCCVNCIYILKRCKSAQLQRAWVKTSQLQQLFYEAVLISLKVG